MTVSKAMREVRTEAKHRSFPRRGKRKCKHVWGLHIQKGESFGGVEWKEVGGPGGGRLWKSL